MPASVVEGIFANEAADTQASAVTEAAGISADASRYAADVQKQIYDQTRADQTPWRQAGANALAQMVSGTTGQSPTYLRPFGASDFQADPGYQFRLDEGLKAIQRSAAARGGLLSGGALKGISRYGQDYASNEYQNAFNRYNLNQGNAFNRLASLAGIGQTATQQVGQAGQAYGTNVGNITMANAANQGNAALAAGNARASAYQGIGNSLGRVNFGNVFGGSGGSSGVWDDNYSYPVSSYDYSGW